MIRRFRSSSSATSFRLRARALGFIAAGLLYAGCSGGGGRGRSGPSSCLSALRIETTAGVITDYWYLCYDKLAPGFDPFSCEESDVRRVQQFDGETCEDLGYDVSCGGGVAALHDCDEYNAEPGDRVAGFSEGIDSTNPDGPDAGATAGTGGASSDGGTSTGGAGGNAGSAGNDVENHITPAGTVTAEFGVVPPEVLDKLRVSDSGNCAVFISNSDWTETPLQREQIVAVDLVTGDAEIISVDASGEPADLGASLEIGIVDVDALVTTEDCQKVVFTSSSALDPIVAEEPSIHAYLRDRVAGTTVALDGPLFQGAASAAAASITPDGSDVAYVCHSEQVISELFGVLIIQPSEILHAPVASLETPQWYDPMPSRIEDGPLGPEATTVSAGGLTLTRDAEHIAFVMSNPDLLGLGANQHAVLRGDLLTGGFELASNEPGGGLLEAVDLYVSASGDGRYIVFRLNYDVAGEPAAGLYIRDLEADTLTLITKDPDGQPIPFTDTGTPQVTGDGRYVIFSMNDTAVIGGPETNLGQVYRYDVEQDTVELITRGRDGLPSDMDCKYPGANYDGTVVAFYCETNQARSNLTTVMAPEFGTLGGIFVYREP